MEKRISMLPHKPHATTALCWFLVLLGFFFLLCETCGISTDTRNVHQKQHSCSPSPVQTPSTITSWYYAAIARDNCKGYTWVGMDMPGP